jgi:hypothetical protein
VKPEKHVPGYFILFDEISVLGDIERAHLFLHPNSDTSPSVIKSNQVYDWDIKECFSDKDIKVKIYLGTEPLRTEIKEGYLASYFECNRITGKYLDCTYEPGISGNQTISTLIFPYLKGDHTPTFSRLSGFGFAGTQLSFNDRLSDLTLSSEVPGEFAYGEISFRAKSLYIRKVNNNILNYFARKGTKLLYKGSNRYGFESKDPVSLVCTGKTGQIISGGTSITIYYPGIEYIRMDGHVAEVIEKGSDWIKIGVPSGNHHFQIGSPHFVR